MIYMIKGAIRWMRFQLKIGISYHAYGYSCGGYQGWYEARGNCIVFKNDEGGNQFVW